MSNFGCFGNRLKLAKYGISFFGGIFPHSPSLPLQPVPFLVLVVRFGDKMMVRWASRIRGWMDPEEQELNEWVNVNGSVGGGGGWPCFVVAIPHSRFHPSQHPLLLPFPSLTLSSTFWIQWARKWMVAKLPGNQKSQGNKLPRNNKMLRSKMTRTAGWIVLSINNWIAARLLGNQKLRSTNMLLSTTNTPWPKRSCARCSSARKNSSSGNRCLSKELRTAISYCVIWPIPKDTNNLVPDTDSKFESIHTIPNVLILYINSTDMMSLGPSPKGLSVAWLSQKHLFPPKRIGLGIELGVF